MDEIKQKKLLPVGISTLENIVGNGKYIYVDKTHHIDRMDRFGSKYLFLSRPRRFGKSLFIDTLKQAFLGRKDLFKGLHLENNWDWNKKYPVIHFDFGVGILKSKAELETKLHEILDSYYLKYKINKIHESVSGKFNYLLEQVTEKYVPAVVLIDEYDKPILDNITETEIAKEMREGLKNLYSVIKGNDANLKFVMLTGVSKFSKVSLFSGLNNLSDITLSSNYPDICGYTQGELEKYFAEYLLDGNVDKNELKKWYNGYNFAGKDEQKVYNPYDILRFFEENCQYRSYWFETGSPRFLIDLIQGKNYFMPNLEKISASDELLLSFDVDDIDIITLLFQTGYLTISEIFKIENEIAYRLTYPNMEVKASLNKRILKNIGNSTNSNECRFDLQKALSENNFAELQNIFTSHFAGIPHDWYRNNNIENYEGFYASVVYSYFAALGYDLIAENVTNHGKIDLTIITFDKVIIAEFKLAKYGSAAEAIGQIKEKKYFEKYINKKLPIYLLAIVFDNKIRNVSEVVSELWNNLDLSKDIF